jgi:hexosaminidase
MPNARKPRLAPIVAVTAAVLLAAGCGTTLKTRGSTPAPAFAITPAPLKLEAHSGAFAVGPSTRIVVLESQWKAQLVARYLKDMLAHPTGYDLPIDAVLAPAGETSGPANAIILRLEDLEGRLGQEGYLLDVGPERILIRAAAPAGLFYGVETLRQLLPPAIEPLAEEGQPLGLVTVWIPPSAKPVTKPAMGPLIVPGVSIEDRPRFAWRGAMLDCSRHFFPKDFVLRWIDILAMHKLNTFHWHLTDDQGWRVEIKRYPNLTEIGAWRVDREDKHWNAREPQQPGEPATYGGFYTQDDIREVVAYAASRFVTIVPEIEMPGHAKGALAAYPEFSCMGGPFTVPPGGYWPITDVFCPGNEKTFRFLEDVLTEVVELFPGPFVHIGGDEVDKTEWKRCPRCQARIKAEKLADESELQSYFVKRVEKVLNAKGKRLIGWDEILEGGLAPQAAVMSWRGTEGGIAAAKAGHDVVMSPTSFCYIDYYQGDPAHEPLAIGGYLPLKQVYAFEPVPDVLDGDEARHILGGQVNLWTEYIHEGTHAEYMALPRLAALAEVVWSAKERRNWDDFAARTRSLLARYEAAGLKAARSAFLVTIQAAASPGAKRAAAMLGTEIPALTIRYTTDGTDPGPRSKRYAKPLVLKKTTELRAAAFEGKTRLSPAVSTERFLVHAASRRAPALTTPPSPQYPGAGETPLTDGLLGSRNHADGRWQGFEGTDFEAVVDLGASKRVGRVSVRFPQNINAWIFLPAAVEFAVSSDGREFETVAQVENDVSPRLADILVKEFVASFEARRVRFVRVLARSIGPVPDWHFGAGGKGWLFVDEIVVE